MSLYHGHQMLWPVYIIIDNLDPNTWGSQTWQNTLLLGSIIVVHKWSEDRNNKDKDLKAKIYHRALKTMLQHKCLSVINMLSIICQSYTGDSTLGDIQRGYWNPVR